MRWLVGLIGMPLGILIIVYREKIYNITGQFDWAEKYLGGGGTFTAFALIGILVFVGSLMWMLGTLQALFYGMFGRFFGA